MLAAVGFYGSLALWMSAGDAPARVFCVLLCGAAIATDNYYTKATRGLVAAALIIVCLAASSVASGFWQFVVLVAVVLHYLVRRIPRGCGACCCCSCVFCWRRGKRALGRARPGREDDPASAGGSSPRDARPPSAPHGWCAATRARASAVLRSGKPRTRYTRAHPLSRALNFVRRGLEFSALVLLLPAITAQSTRLRCLDAASAPFAERVVWYDRYAARADGWIYNQEPGEPLLPRTWVPTDGNTLFRTDTDDNATYAVLHNASRALFFAGTHTLKMVQADFDIAPLTVEYTTPIRLRTAGGAAGANGTNGGGASAPPCGSVTVSRGFWRVYEAVRGRAVQAVREWQAAAARGNASVTSATGNAGSVAAPGTRILIGGFSLGGAAAPLAAMDLICSGEAAPGDIHLVSMAGPGAGAAEWVRLLERLQGLGLTAWRVVSAFDIVPWLPALLYEPMRTDAAYVTFTASGTLVIVAHKRAGYLPSVASAALRMDACAQLRAWAFVPVLAAAALYGVVAALDLLLARRASASGQQPQAAPCAAAAPAAPATGDTGACKEKAPGGPEPDSEDPGLAKHDADVDLEAGVPPHT